MKLRGEMQIGRIGAGLGLVSLLALAGCGGTTYGTGTPAEQQLLEDVTGALSLAPKNKQNISYAPRPGIVKPPSTEVLPPPQDDVAEANPAWPESPEERLARIRAEATENQNNQFYRSNVVRDVNYSDDKVGPAVSPLSRAEQKAEIERRKALARQGSPNTRRYLSEPPVDYRQPAASAPVGELGEDEAKKERKRRKATAENTGGLRRLIPWM